jgi:hypothetical protein
VTPSARVTHESSSFARSVARVDELRASIAVHCRREATCALLVNKTDRQQRGFVSAAVMDAYVRSTRGRWRWFAVSARLPGGSGGLRSALDELCREARRRRTAEIAPQESLPVACSPLVPQALASVPWIEHPAQVSRLARVCALPPPVKTGPCDMSECGLIADIRPEGHRGGRGGAGHSAQTGGPGERGPARRRARRVAAGNGRPLPPRLVSKAPMRGASHSWEERDWQ